MNKIIFGSNTCSTGIYNYKPLEYVTTWYRYVVIDVVSHQYI